MNVFAQVAERSGGNCEAMVTVRGTWARCGVSPIQIHHKLLRSRGGDVLDEAGETDHLIALCAGHHGYAHAYPQQAYKSGLIIDGQAWLEGGKVVYRGSNQRLFRKYAAHKAVS